MLDLDPKGFRHLKDKNLLCLQTICEKSFREGIKLPFFLSTCYLQGHLTILPPFVLLGRTEFHGILIFSALLQLLK